MLREGVNYIVGGKVVVSDRFVAIFGRKFGSFSPKILEGFFLSKPVSAILRLKKREKKSSDGH